MDWCLISRRKRHLLVWSSGAQRVEQHSCMCTGVTEDDEREGEAGLHERGQADRHHQ